MVADAKLIMEVRYVDYGLANRFSNYIELNKNLKKYPKLHDSILKHELSHTDKTWSWEDFKLDFSSDSSINELAKIKFMFKYPKSLTQILPVYWSKGKGIVYDLNLIVMYLIYIGVFTLTLFIGRKII